MWGFQRLDERNIIITWELASEHCYFLSMGVLEKASSALGAVLHLVFVVSLFLFVATRALSTSIIIISWHGWTGLLYNT